MRRVVRAKACFADGPNDVFQRPVPQEIQTLLAEVKLDVLCRRFLVAAVAGDLLVSCWHLRRLFCREIPLLDQFFDYVVQQFCDLFFDLGVPGTIPGSFAPEDLQHFGCEFSRLH